MIARETLDIRSGKVVIISEVDRMNWFSIVHKTDRSSYINISGLIPGTNWA